MRNELFRSSNDANGHAAEYATGNADAAKCSDAEGWKWTRTGTEAHQRTRTGSTIPYKWELRWHKMIWKLHIEKNKFKFLVDSTMLSKVTTLLSPNVTSHRFLFLFSNNAFTMVTLYAQVKLSGTIHRIIPWKPLFLVWIIEADEEIRQKYLS